VFSIQFIQSQHIALQMFHLRLCLARGSFPTSSLADGFCSDTPLIQVTATSNICLLQEGIEQDERFQVLTATDMKMAVFWDVATCKPVCTDKYHIAQCDIPQDCHLTDLIQLRFATLLAFMKTVH
jgi:hypothetical protein